jgi:hypothetical protein
VKNKVKLCINECLNVDFWLHIHTHLINKNYIYCALLKQNISYIIYILGECSCVATEMYNNTIIYVQMCVVLL